MAQYDGSIRINTKISTKDAKVQISALQHTIVKTADEIASLRSKMGALEDVKTPTEAYEEMEKQLLGALNTLEELEEKQKNLPKEFSQMSANELAEQAKAAWEEFNKTTEELSQMDVKLSELEGKMEELRKKDGDPDGILPDVESDYNALMAHYKELQDENSKTLKQISAINDTIKVSEKIEKAKESVTHLNEKLKEMEDTGKAFSLGTDTEEYQNLARQLKNEQKALAKMKFQAAALGGFEKLGKIKDSFKKLGETAKSAFSKVNKSAKKSGGSISSFGSRIKGLVASALIFNQVSKAFNLMFSGMKEGFGNLYNEVGGFKSTVDGLKASALTLKNSLAAAFRPLVEAAIPYIQKAIEYITRLVDSFGQIIAAITGQKTYTKAIKQTTAALEEAKEAEEGYLSPLDEINKFQKKDSQADTGGATGPMFEEVPINSKFLEMANRVKEVMAQLFQPLKTAWENQGQFVMDSWKYALEEVGLLAQSVGEDFLAVWNQPETISVLENILIIAGDIGLVVGNLAARFREAWEANDVGLRILENIRNLFGIIIEHVRNAADATVEWSKNLDFSPMLESINGLLEALQPLADNIGAGLEWFYTNVLLPIAGWTIEEAIPTFLDMLSAAIGVVNEVIEALKPLGMWLWEEFLQPIGQWAGDTIIAAMETITDLLKKFGNWISEHQEAVQNFTIIIGAFATAWGVVSAAVGIWNGIAAIASTVTTAFGAAITFLTSPIGLVTLAIGALIAGFTLLYKNSESFRNFIDGIVEGAKNLIPGIIEGIKSGWDSFIGWLGDLWQGIVDGFKSFFGIHSPSTLMMELGGYLVMGLIEGIKNLVGKVEEIWESMKQFAVDTWNGVKDWLSDTWSSIKQTASQKWGEIKQNLSEKWSQMKSDAKSKFDEIGTNIANAWAKTKENTASAWSTIKEKAVSASDSVKTGVMNAWNALKTGTSNVWDSIMNAVKRPINGILGFVESLANGVVNAINTVIRALNRLSFDIPDWIPLIGGNHFGFNIPELGQVPIPRLATGAVIPANKEFLAVLGDQKHGTNIEAPLDTIKQAQKESILEVLSALGITGAVRTGNSQPKEIVLKVDRRELGRVMIDEGNLQMMSTGKNIFMLGVT